MLTVETEDEAIASDTDVRVRRAGHTQNLAGGARLVRRFDMGMVHGNDFAIERVVAPAHTP